jgi:hypothetical protein
MGEAEVIAHAPILGLSADKDSRSCDRRGIRRRAQCLFNFLPWRLYSLRTRRICSARCSADGIAVEIARRKRKLADAKESRQWADGVVSTSARSEGTNVLLCSAIREWELWDGKGVRKKLGKEGRRARTGVFAGEERGTREDAVGLIRRKEYDYVGKESARIPWWVAARVGLSETYNSDSFLL